MDRPELLSRLAEVERSKAMIATAKPLGILLAIGALAAAVFGFVPQLGAVGLLAIAGFGGLLALAGHYQFKWTVKESAELTQMLGQPANGSFELFADPAYDIAPNPRAIGSPTNGRHRSQVR